MNLTFYKNQSEKNKIGKNLTDAKDVIGTLRENCDILNPSILAENTTYPDYNYMYIPDFKRYYFITNIVSVRFGLWQITAHVDVLETYQAQIKEQKAVVARQAEKYNLYLNDPEWKVYTNKQVLTRTFPKGFSDSGNYYLTVVGGYENESNI